jgi:PleD family two-component response regulator
MEGEIYLDETFTSGVAGCPGTRIVVNLKLSPEDASDLDAPDLDVSPLTAAGNETVDSSANSDAMQQDEVVQEQQQQQSTLPEDWKVLLVDDDRTLRKLVSRSLRKVAPSWTVSEASGGETALRMTAENDYDLIFMDQYMASGKKNMPTSLGRSPGPSPWLTLSRIS